mgnify:CR=1 FL=1
MINKKLAKKIIELGLTTGADFAELFCENSYSHSIVLDQDIIDNIGNISISGVGIRLLKENRSVYGYTNEVKEKNLVELVNKLKAAFTGNKVIDCRDFNDRKIISINPNNGTYFKTPIQDRIAILKHLSEVMKNYSPLITRTVVSFSAKLIG